MSEVASDTAVQVRIRGKVQGVWYRGWLVQEATRAGLRGWVRNRKDGSVEALLIGPNTAIQGIIELLNEGPPSAVVAAVDRTVGADDGSTGFRQRQTC